MQASAYRIGVPAQAPSRPSGSLGGFRAWASRREMGTGTDPKTVPTRRSKGLIETVNFCGNRHQLKLLGEQIPASKLWEWVQASQTDPTHAQAAANAISALNATGVPITQSVAGAKLRGADLRESILDGSFDETDLTNATLTRSYLGPHTSFLGTVMSGVQLGFGPFMPLQKSGAQFSRVVGCQDESKLGVVDGGELYLWTRETEQFSVLDTGSTQKIEQLKMSPDGRYMGIVRENMGIVVWDSNAGQKLAEFSGTSVAFHPHAQQIAIGGDQMLEIWTLSGTPEKVKEVAYPEQTPISVLEFSPQGDRIAAGGLQVHLWNMDENMLAQVYGGGTQKASSLSFSPDGRFLAVGCRAFVLMLATLVPASQVDIRVWEVTWHSNVPLLLNPFPLVDEIKSNAGSVTDLHFRPGGDNILAYSTLQGTVFSRDIVKKQELDQNRWGRILQGFWFVEGGEVVVTAALDEVQFHLTQMGFNNKGHAGSISAVAVNGPQGLIATGGDDRVVQIRDLKRGYRLQDLSFAAPVQGLSFLKEGQVLAIQVSYGEAEDQIQFWDTASWQRLPGPSLAGVLVKDSMVLTRSDWGEVVVVMDDGRKMISVFKTENEEKVLDFPDKTNGISVIRLDSNREWILSGREGNNVGIWNLATGELIKELPGHTKAPTRIEVSSDQRFWVTASEAETIVWDAQTQAPIFTLSEKTNVLAFSPKGDHLAIGDQDISIWNIATQTKVLTLGCPWNLSALAWTTDGLVSTDYSGSVYRWDVESDGQLLWRTGGDLYWGGVDFSQTQGLTATQRHYLQSKRQE